MPGQPSEQALAGRIGAHASWAKTRDRAARTAPARAAFDRRFEDEVDPDRILDPAERARRAESARQAYFARLALKSAQARRRATKEVPTDAPPDVPRPPHNFNPRADGSAPRQGCADDPHNGARPGGGTGAGQETGREALESEQQRTPALARLSWNGHPGLVSTFARRRGWFDPDLERLLRDHESAALAIFDAIGPRRAADVARRLAALCEELAR